MPDRYGASSTLASGGAPPSFSAPAGAAGAPQPNLDPANPPPGWQYDPITKLWQNGRLVFQAGAPGQPPVQIHDQDLGTQVANNLARSSAYAGLGSGYDAALKATMGQQSSLADAYRQTISDPNAPSVAREQLNQALTAADASQESAAAGASGENAFLARRGASANMAGLAANAGQSAALARAQEVANAQQGLQGTLGSEANEAGGAVNTYTGLGLNYANTAGTEEMGGNANVTAQRGQNIQAGESVGKDVAAGVSGAVNPAGAVGGALNFTPPAGPDDIAHLST